MNKYANSCLYIIKCADATIADCYVGSSIDFPNRLNTHHHDYKTKPNTPLYKCIKEHGEWNNWLIDIIPTPCDSNVELRHHEQELINKLCPTLNVNEAQFQPFN